MTNNIFEDLGFEKEEAQNLKLRALLMLRLRKHIEKNELTQTQAAEAFNVSQPRVSNLVKGKIDKFTIDMLVNMAASVGITVELRIPPVKKAVARKKAPAKKAAAKIKVTKAKKPKLKKVI